CRSSLHVPCRGENTRSKCPFKFDHNSISPLLMGWLIQFGGGWENPAGYIYAFFTMAGCALLGMLLQLMTTDKTPRKAH
ncbi:hypothetical protein ACUTF9_14915, partial [Klebsiella pneumoniae]